MSATMMMEGVLQIFGIDINQVVELGTQVATSGSIRAGEIVGDDIFEYLVGIAVVIYEMNPGSI